MPQDTDNDITMCTRARAFGACDMLQGTNKTPPHETPTVLGAAEPLGRRPGADDLATGRECTPLSWTTAKAYPSPPQQYQRDSFRHITTVR